MFADVVKGGGARGDLANQLLYSSNLSSSEVSAAAVAAVGPTRSTSIDAVSVKLTVLPSEALTVVQKLGEGQFGEIHLCQLDGVQTVAVKSLRKDCDSNARYTFKDSSQGFSYKVRQ